MQIVVHPYAQSEAWITELRSALPNDTLHLWPEVPELSEVDLLVAWIMRRADVRTMTNLRAILSLGAGTEQWQKDGMPDVPVVRLADPAMADDMAAYALHWAWRFMREFDLAANQQADGIWDTYPSPAPQRTSVGILGYGTIGARIGRAFAEFGHPVNAWSRSGRGGDGVRVFAGPEQLDAFLAASSIIVNVLPNTAATTGLLSAERFRCCGEGTVFINIGRGTVTTDVDLIEALDDGPLRAAVLDVTDPEPPLSDSPLWTHSAIHLTPHVAGVTRPETAAPVIAANIERIRAGEEPFPLLERTRGY